MEPTTPQDGAQLQSLTIPCKRCGALVAIDPHGPVAKMAMDFGTFCDACMKEETKPPPRSMLSHSMPFAKYCPPCFEDTSFEHLPCPRLSILALEWQFGAEGLNLWGWPGTGKTRTMSLLIKAMHEAGHSIICFGPGGFRAGCIAHNHRRPPWLDKLSKVDLLLFDDMDKMNLTREQERDLFEVLTNRMGRKPVMLTGNANGRAIEFHFRLGEPMVRRIRDHCRSIHFDESDIAKRLANR